MPVPPTFHPEDIPSTRRDFPDDLPGPKPRDLLPLHVDGDPDTVRAWTDPADLKQQRIDALRHQITNAE